MQFHDARKTQLYHIITIILFSFFFLMLIYLHHGVFFYELVVAGCERQVPVYAQRANKRNDPERVHSE